MTNPEVDGTARSCSTIHGVWSPASGPAGAVTVRLGYRRRPNGRGQTSRFKHDRHLQFGVELGAWALLIAADFRTGRHAARRQEFAGCAAKPSP